MWRTLGIGADYLAGSMRGRSGDQEFLVEEIDPSAGTFRIDAPENFDGEVTIDFQRTVLRAQDRDPDEVIGTSDACIYCGAQSGLQDEHIIPFGLGGSFVLRKGSCSKCAVRTSQFERAVLRDAFLPARSALNIRTRKPHKRPAAQPVIIGKDRRVLHLSI